MIYKFIDNNGTFCVENPQKYNCYFPLTNQRGTLLSSISSNLAGDIKSDNEHFLTPPASIEDLKNNLLCRREFFLKTGKETLRFSSGPDGSLEAGFLYHKIIKRSKHFNIEIINFIPYNLAVEVMWIKVSNNGDKTVAATPTSFIPLYGRPEKNLRDHRHVSSLLNRIHLEKHGVYLRPTMTFDESGHKINNDIYFVLGFENEGLAPLGQFPTLDYFCGEGDLLHPDAVEKGKKPVAKEIPLFQGKEACAAFRFRKRQLRPAKEAEYFLIMGIEKDAAKIKKVFARLDSPSKVKYIFAETKKYWQDSLGAIDFDFKDKHFNNWLLWVKMQPTLRKLFGCSFLPHFDYGKGGRGWRDLWQDGLTLLITEPDKARNLILGSFKGVRIDGSNATIITKEGDFISDRNCIARVWMDHGVWPYLTTRLYLHKTGDLSILLKGAVYFRDRLLMRAKEIDAGFSQSDYILRDRNNKIYQGSILEHLLIQNLVQFFNVGEHNIIRLENADWNDGFDMAPERGESVTFSFMYAHNLKDICVILEELKKRQDSLGFLEELGILLDRINEPVNYLSFKEKQKRLKDYLEKTKSISGKKIKVKIDDLINDLSQKAEHLCAWLREKEWLAAGFFNGYYDNKGRRVEGRLKGRINLMLSPQVFAIMSGVASDKQVKTMWASLKRHLKDRESGGFRLNTDFGPLYTDLGRAFGFSYGDKENGAFFNHMVVMLANSLYKRGFIEEGYEALNSIYRMASNERSQIFPMLPEYFNNEGRGLYHYLTGSASWYIYTLMEEVLGIKSFLGDIVLEPKLTERDFARGNIEVKFRIGRKTARVIYFKNQPKKKIYRPGEVFLEGQMIKPSGGKFVIKKESINRINRKEILIKVGLA